jgi:hypothetical protein
MSNFKELKRRVVTLRSTKSETMINRLKKKHPNCLIFEVGNVAWMPKDTKGREYYQHFIIEKK